MAVPSQSSASLRRTRGQVLCTCRRWTRDSRPRGTQKSRLAAALAGVPTGIGGLRPVLRTHGCAVPLLRCAPSNPGAGALHLSPPGAAILIPVGHKKSRLAAAFSWRPHGDWRPAAGAAHSRLRRAPSPLRSVEPEGRCFAPVATGRRRFSSPWGHKKAALRRRLAGVPTGIRTVKTSITQLVR